MKGILVKSNYLTLTQSSVIDKSAKLCSISVNPEVKENIIRDNIDYAAYLIN